MPTPPLSRFLLQQAVDAIAKHGTQNAAARALDIPRCTLQSRLDQAYRINISPNAAGKDTADDVGLRDKVFELEAQLRAIRGNSLDEEYVKRKILGLRDGVGAQRVPEWVVSSKRGRTLPGVPCALWSDWHAGEVVDAKQINGKNEYDWEIMERRIKHLVATTINLLRNHVVNPEYPGIVVNLGGDMVSGDIHEELSETNDRPMMPVVLDLFSVLKWAIGSLADEFGQVFVPCVTGNHGRNTRKPRAKQRNFTNFDWLLYQFLSKSFEGDERVTFLIPDGPDALYDVVGHRYLLTHGDQFRGGDGIIGHYGPVLRGQKRKLSRNANIGLEFDTLLHGHFHTYFPTPAIIGNGSLKGMDEYAYAANFGYELPIQALWLTHPEHGITIHMPVYLEGRYDRDNSAKEWVSWHRQ